MNKKMTTFFVVGLLIAATSAFAQLKPTPKVAKTLTNIDAAIMRATQPSVKIFQRRALYMQQMRASGKYQQAWANYYRGDMQASAATATCKFYTMHPELLYSAMTQIIDRTTGHRFLILEPVATVPGVVDAEKQVFIYSLDNPGKEGIEVGRDNFLEHTHWYKVIK